MQIAYEKLEKLVADIFAANGAPEKDAKCTAEIMVVSCLSKKMKSMQRLRF